MLTSSRSKLTTLFAVPAVAAIVAVAWIAVPTLGLVTPPRTEPDYAGSAAGELAQITSPDGVLRFDAAENATRFVWSQQPVHEDGLPAYGNAYITEGYLYPAGILTDRSGVNPDGSPEFPDKVLGRWICRGTHVGDGAHTETGPWVISTQLFNFGDEWGKATLISEGFLIADVGDAIDRAITGGTGPFAGARGEQRETMLGFNASNGVNVRVEVRLTSP
jgi:hypothetical protein